MDGKETQFRLKKLDAFSGAALLRLLSRLPEPEDEESPLFSLFRAIPDADFRALMTTCLQHVEILLPAGYIPVITRGEWSCDDLEYDTAACLKLTTEEVLWTLEGFFAEGASISRTGTPAS